MDFNFSHSLVVLRFHEAAAQLNDATFIRAVRRKGTIVELMNGLGSGWRRMTSDQCYSTKNDILK